MLQEEGFLVKDLSLNNIIKGVEEVTLDKRSGFTNYKHFV
jgi:hypothetical protein